MQIDLSPLLKQARAYMERSGIPATKFGMEAVGSPNLMARLETGNVTLKTVRRVEEFLAKQKRKRP